MSEAADEFVRKLEQRSMSTWTPAEMRRYNRLTGQGDTMTYEVMQDKKFPNDWRAEAISDSGDIFVAVFSGPDAECRAREYARMVCPHVWVQNGDSDIDKRVVHALRAIWAGVPDELRRELDSAPSDTIFAIPAMVGALRLARAAIAELEAE